MIFPEISRNALATGLMLAGLALVVNRRRRGFWAAGLAVISVVVSIYLEVVVQVSDAWMLPSYTGLARPSAMLVTWAAWGVALWAAERRPSIPGPPIVTAPLMGALVGSLPAAALLSRAARDRKAAARLALAAAAGGMVGRVGNPALLVLGLREPWVAWGLAPLAAACLAVAAPRRGDLVPGEGDSAASAALHESAPSAVAPGDPRLSAVAVAVALVALLPGGALWALVGGVALTVGLGLRRWRRIDSEPLLWAIASVGLVLLAVAGGAADMVAWGLEELQLQAAQWMPAVLGAGGAVLAALTGGPASALFSVAVLDRALSLRVVGAPVALAAGLAAGGLGPLVVSGGLRAGWSRWLVQVLLAVGWAVIAVKLA